MSTPRINETQRPSLPPMGEGQKPSKVYGHIEITPEVQSRWTSNLNLVSEIMGVPSVVVTRLHEGCLEIAAANDGDTNPYKKTMTANLDTGMCCEAVMYGRRTLWIPNALTDPEWANNPNVSLGLVAYLGLPLEWPNGDIFGTMALLDREEHFYSETERRLLGKFKEAVEADIKLLVTLSERERIQKDLAAARDAAEAANRAKSTFLAHMSHELRTPLNAILGYTELLGREPNLAKERKEQLDIIGSSGQHLLTLINDVLALSRVEASMAQLKRESFELERLLMDTIAMFRLKTESKGIDLTLTRAEGLPQIISGDSVKLRQVLINLLGNAIKFTTRGCVDLCVSAHADGEDTRLTFTVSDTGCGVDADELEKIFEPFAQSAAGSLQQGAGLGLAISRGFVTLMGGELTATSRPGVGSTFRFDIATQASEPLATAHGDLGAVIGLTPGASSRRVLICEDNTANRTLLHALLVPQGFELRDAADGHAAVEVATSWKPDAILMDLRLPGINGYEATRRIRTLEGSGTPIIAVTASTFADEEAEALSAGCTQIIRKPFTANALFTALGQSLNIPLVRAAANNAQACPDAEPAETDFSSLSDAWREAMHSAALAADGDQLKGVLDAIAPEHPEIAISVRALMDGFRYDVIADLSLS